MSAPDYEMLHDEFGDLQLHCWNKFYSYVVQYHQVSFFLSREKSMGVRWLLFWVVPGALVNKLVCLPPWSASRKLGFLTLLCSFVLFIYLSVPEKPLMVRSQLNINFIILFKIFELLRVYFFPSG